MREREAEKENDGKKWNEKRPLVSTATAILMIKIHLLLKMDDWTGMNAEDGLDLV